MQRSTTSMAFSSSDLADAPVDLLPCLLSLLGQIVRLACEFRESQITAASTCRFEETLQLLLSELGRRIVEWTFNSIEPDDVRRLPDRISHDLEVYRRRRKSDRRQPLWTLFGPVQLTRTLYSAFTAGEPSLFPLEIDLGLVHGATPALALRAGFLAAEMTQQKTLDTLKADHQVTWSKETLRKVVRSVSEAMSEQSHAALLERLLELLRLADASKGGRKIVLSVGRDGVFVPIVGASKYQEGAAATLSVHDRAARRLGTVYLGRMPEERQRTLSRQLTALIEDVLRRWEGPMPRLCYVTDAGWHPTEYFHAVLQRMRHPRTGKSLRWRWVVDYFHAAGRIRTLAEAIFGEHGKEAFSWARKMRRWLKDKPNGAFRVLHSAAALRSQRGLRGSVKSYDEAYNYLRERLRHLNYVDYRRRGLPIGSGVTEAACKIVFTQRFKQSGMKWTIEGGQIILDLRSLRLSRVWDAARAAYLETRPAITTYPRTKTNNTATSFKIAA